MQEHKDKLAMISEEINYALEKIDFPTLQNSITSLTSETEGADFWNNPEKAKLTTMKLSAMKKEFEDWKKLGSDCAYLCEISPTINMDKDPDTCEEFKNMVDELEKYWRKLEIKAFLSGKYDNLSAIMSIHAGTGGKDAMDFVEMLLRMYLKWCDNQGYITEILDRSDGEEVGIKSVTISINGPFAYGYLKCEKGVHRLVRNSPFNAKNSRETSFALVEIMPDVDISYRAKVNKDDLKIDTFRSGGAGGQNVNKVSSAVRITHIPTGLVVTCQAERSQLQNKDRAMQILMAKLIDLAEKQQVEELSSIKGEPIQMSWGNQIRSYILHPYTLVKDHRTGHEEHDVHTVLEGNIDDFIESKLKAK